MDIEKNKQTKTKQTNTMKLIAIFSPFLYIVNE